jgi:hypothetical protein
MVMYIHFSSFLCSSQLSTTIYHTLVEREDRYSHLNILNSFFLARIDNVLNFRLPSFLQVGDFISCKMTPGVVRVYKRNILASRLLYCFTRLLVFGKSLFHPLRFSSKSALC